jgi:hypothetical protein
MSCSLTRKNSVTLFEGGQHRGAAASGRKSTNLSPFSGWVASSQTIELTRSPIWSSAPEAAKPAWEIYSSFASPAHACKHLSSNLPISLRKAALSAAADCV